jgi:hypothetical protein
LGVTVKNYEKRDAERVPMEVPVEFSLAGYVWQEGQAVNVSYRGILLRTKEQLPPGENIKVRFKLPNQSEGDPIEAEGKVVRITPQSGYWVVLAAELEFVRPEYQIVIRNYVDRLL